MSSKDAKRLDDPALRGLLGRADVPLRGRVRASALLTGISAVVLAGPAWADCTSDAQCKGDRICENSVCVSPPAPPTAAAPAAPPVTPGPAPAPAGGTNVLFVGSADDFVVAEGNDGSPGGECRLPCSLTLQPGFYTVRNGDTSGPIEVRDQITTVEFTQGCTTCFFTGGIGLTLSVPFFVGAGVMFEKGDEQIAIPLTIGGGVMAATGVTFLILGLALGGGDVEQNETVANDDPSPLLNLALTQSGVGISF